MSALSEGLPSILDHELASRLTTLGCSIEPCGSRVTCVPCRPDADHDFLVVLDPPRPGSIEVAIANVVEILHEAGFAFEGSEHYQRMMADDFMSWRLGDINLIVTANPRFAERHRAATYVAKRLNLQNKPDRIALFQAVLYGNRWEN